MRLGAGALLLGLVIVGAAAATMLARPGLRAALFERLPSQHRIALLALLRGVQVDHDVRIVMPDGIGLAASVYRPRGVAGPLPTILIRMPYHRLHYGEGYWNATHFARHGYAVVVQDLRGTGDSEGRLLPWRDAGTDGVATLDWITAQPWSDGKVGTFGCSALGETQYALARMNHPAHRAMVPSGAGGAIGSALGRHGYFGLFEGGVFQLASGFGWFVGNGSHDPKAPPAMPFDTARHLRELPVANLVAQVRPAPNGYADFLATPLGHPRWAEWGYWSDADRSAVPALVFNTWGDQTVGDTLALAEVWARHGVPQTVVIGPGNHCQHVQWERLDRFGDLPVTGAGHPRDEWTLRWFDHWLKGRRDALDGLPAYSYFMLVENRWRTAERWPPPQSRSERWYLASGGHANSRAGDGRLVRGHPDASSAASDAYSYDPADPVPSRGGPLCCTGDPNAAAGPADQADVERRDDVLVYTSAPLEQDLRIAGPLRAHLSFASDAADTDLVVRLAHVRPDGLASSIQEGALRLRYRDGVQTPRLLRPGQVVQATVDLRAIAYMLPRGHRLRLQVTSSSFPRLERNLNTGAANNAAETRMVVAANRVVHSSAEPSWLELPVLLEGTSPQ
ncbi:MAG: CocE/NonD family hydrolase [Rubrivivax sp.]|nr:CocE/NonD family hydrolase [Rubrivivax sp.]